MRQIISVQGHLARLLAPSATRETHPAQETDCSLAAPTALSHTPAHAPDSTAPASRHVEEVDAGVN